jgi:hypothetical protein
MQPELGPDGPPRSSLFAAPPPPHDPAIGGDPRLWALFGTTLVLHLGGALLFGARPGVSLLVDLGLFWGLATERRWARSWMLVRGGVGTVVGVVGAVWARHVDGSLAALLLLSAAVAAAWVVFLTRSDVRARFGSKAGGA